MTFKDKLCSGQRPRCVDCIYFDKKLLMQPGASLHGVMPAHGRLVEVHEGDNSGICRIDPPGPAALNGWIKIIDGPTGPS
jgi:hypothetical protein